MSDRATRFVGLYAAVAAVAALVVSPLLALSYFATEDGKEELASDSVAAWAEPARELAGSLLTWASPDRVYATYLQAFVLLFPAFLLCAWAVRDGRPETGRAERWGWRIALAGYALAGAGLLAVGALLAGANPDLPAVDVAFLALLLPGMLATALGSSVLGIALWRAGFRPRVTAWLLALAFPSMVVVPALLGHNSIGMLPFMLAWGAAGIALRGATGSHPADAAAQPAR